MRSLSFMALSVLALAGVSAAADIRGRSLRPVETDALIESLLDQGVARRSIVRVDPTGVPVTCEAITAPQERAAQRLAGGLGVSGLPAGHRAWEVIPGVLRTNGSDSCRVEVDTNGPVTRVTMDRLDWFYLDTPGPDSLEMRDDGQGLDRVAGDFIYTAGPFHVRAGAVIPAYYRFDTSSPAGLFTSHVGRVVVEELNHSLSEFLLWPEVGLLRADIPNRPVAASPAPNIVTMAHLINVRTSTRETQKSMRFGGDLALVTRPIYDVLPDAFDFLVFFSTDKVEQLPYTSRSNFNAGVHYQAQTNYTGTGLQPYAGQTYYGSPNRLLSLNLLDAFDRGIEGNNVTHEITHQWAAYTNTALSDGTAHYGDCSVGSMVGGLLWVDNGNGTFTRNCNEGRNGAHHAPPLDLYLMGLVSASSVLPLHVATSPFSCTAPVTSWSNVTVADIQALHGPRTPKPAQAQKKFQIGFVAESHDRLLTPTELTFYEILAEHYTKVLPPSAPDPYLGFNWAPVTRYFANGSKWGSTIPAPMASARAALPASSMSDARARLALHVSPNPGSKDVSFRWESPVPPAGGSMRLEVFDLAGRRLRMFRVSAADGAGSLSWDGRDDAGRLVRSGAYVCRLTDGNTSVTQRFTRVE